MTARGTMIMIGVRMRASSAVFTGISGGIGTGMAVLDPNGLARARSAYRSGYLDRSGRTGLRGHS
jgi:hypothetical protein